MCTYVAVRSCAKPYDAAVVRTTQVHAHYINLFNRKKWRMTMSLQPHHFYRAECIDVIIIIIIIIIIIATRKLSVCLSNACIVTQRKKDLS